MPHKVFLVRSLTASSGRGKSGETDLPAIQNLQAAGFVKIKSLNTSRVAAEVSRGEEAFFLMYDANSPANQKPFQLIHMRSGQYRQIDCGGILSADDEPNPRGNYAITAKGRSLMNVWDLICDAAKPDVAAECNLAIKRNEIKPFGSEFPNLVYKNGAKPEAAKTVDEEARKQPPQGTQAEQPKKAEDRVVEKVEDKAKPVFPGEPLKPELTARKILIARIRRNPEQPRKTFRQSALLKLSESIRAQGQTDPIEVVRIEGDPEHDYEIVRGERRWTAIHMGGGVTIDAIVKTRAEIPDRKTQNRICFASDSNRETYGDVEMTMAVIEQHEEGLTAKEISSICGKDLRWIYTRLALARLDKKLLVLLDPSLPRAQKLSISVAKELCRIPSEQQQAGYQRIKAIKSIPLQIQEAKRMVMDLDPTKVKTRKTKPSTQCKLLKGIIPRMLANIVLTEQYSDAVFRILTENGNAVEADLMLQHISETKDKLQSLEARILKAKQEHDAKKT